MVTAVVPVWNGREHLVGLLADLRAAWPPELREVILIDNASADGARELVEETVASGEGRYRAIYNDSNEGFTTPCNQGILAAVAADDILLLNSDVRLGVSCAGQWQPAVGWLGKLCEVADDEVAVVVPRQVNLTGGLHAVEAYIDAEHRGWPQPEFPKDRNQYAGLREIESVPFSCALLTRRGLEVCGLLEESLPIDGSDSLYCRVAQALGWRILCRGDVTLTHAVGGSRDSVRGWAEQRLADTARLRAILPEWRSYRGLVNLHGPLGYNTGYGKLAWNIGRALRRAGLAVAGLPYYDVSTVSVVEPHLFGDLLRQKPDPQAPTILVGVTSEGAFWGQGPMLGVTMLECDPVPEAFATDLNRCREVWTYSEFNARTFREAGTTCPIRLMPPLLDGNLYHPEITPLRLPQRRGFAIGAVFEWSERKWPDWIDFALRALSGLDASLHLRINGPGEQWRADLERIIRRAGANSTVPVYLIEQPLGEPDMGAFYRALDVLVAPGPEGIGLPLLEAAACGVPVIGLDWGCGAQYIQDPRLRLAASGQVRCPPGNRYYEGGRWAVPDMYQLTRLLLEVYWQRESYHRAAMRRAPLVRAAYGLEEAGEAYALALEEALREGE